VSEPVYDVSHLGRVELLTPDLPADGLMRLLSK